MLSNDEIRQASKDVLANELIESILFIQKAKLRRSLSSKVGISDLRKKRKYIARIKTISHSKR
jgi:ribosomal protein L29